MTYAIEPAKPESNRARPVVQNSPPPFRLVCDAATVDANLNVAGRRAQRGRRDHGAALARSKLETDFLMPATALHHLPTHCFITNFGHDLAS